MNYAKPYQNADGSNCNEFSSTQLFLMGFGYLGSIISGNFLINKFAGNRALSALATTGAIADALGSSYYFLKEFYYQSIIETIATTTEPTIAAVPLPLAPAMIAAPLPPVAAHDPASKNNFELNTNSL